jgi:RNA 3'-terminal phosphate cyclase (ATP)
VSSEIHIDGSQGEGGGQIVRSSLALSLVTGRAVTIDKIRAGRKKSGLMRQHLTAVHAAAEICGGKVSGAEIGSTELRFEPLPPRAGKYRFSVGTAGGATLVLQTVLPALLIADGPSDLVLEGGTHNPWAPPFDFLQKSFLPLINKMGPRVSATIERHGFYPAGGGRFCVTIEPSSTLAGFDLMERGPITHRAARALVANLPLHIAEREVKTLLRKMTWDEACGAAGMVDAHGPGNVVLIEIGSDSVTEVFTGFGRTGVKAERVADEVIDQARDYLQTSAAVGPYLADQIMLPLGISAWQQTSARHQRGGSFLTLPLTRHSSTHIDILRQFLGVAIRTESIGNTCCVSLNAG